eukprot:813220_1
MAQLEPCADEKETNQERNQDLALIKQENQELLVTKEKVLNSILKEFDEKAGQMTVKRNDFLRLFRVELENTRKKRQYAIDLFVTLDLDKAYEGYSDKMRKNLSQFQYEVTTEYNLVKERQEQTNTNKFGIYGDIGVTELWKAARDVGSVEEYVYCEAKGGFVFIIAAESKLSGDPLKRAYGYSAIVCVLAIAMHFASLYFHAW